MQRTPTVVASKDPLPGRTLGGFAWILATLLVLTTGSPRAGEVPLSALSSSLLVPGEFLEGPSLAYAFPQWGARFESRAYFTSGSFSFSGSSSEGASGVLWNLDRQAVFLLSQPYETTTLDLSPNLTQVGWAADWGPVGVGAAIRYAEETEDQTETDLDEGVSNWASETSQNMECTELSVGLGFGASNARVDIVGDLRRETSSLHLHGDSVPDTSDVRVDSESPLGGKITARVAVPVSEHARILLVGSFDDTSIDRDFVLRHLGVADSVATFRDREYGHRWTAGIAWEMERPEFGRIRTHGFYFHDRDPAAFEGRGRSGRVSWTGVRVKEERALFGVSLERELFPDTVLLAGFRGAFTVREWRSSRQETNSEVRYEREVDEYLSREFAWGLTHSWRNVDLVGAMRGNLSLSQLFLRIDASIRF